MNSVSRTRIFLLFINITACMFIMTVIACTSHFICDYSRATEFLSLVKCIPANPYFILIKTSLICGFFIITFIQRQIFFADNKNIIYITLAADAVMIVVLLHISDCNYNGFILWLLANIIFYIDVKLKYVFLVLGLFAYMIVSHELFSVYNHLFNVNDYINFYSIQNQHLLFTALNILKTLNLIGFIYFCIQVIRQQKDTIDEKERLYAELEKANEQLKNYADIKEKMGQTKERNRIAMEIHDTIGHSLTGISVGVDTCLAIMDANPVAAKKQLGIISAVAKDGIADVRRSVRTLQVDERQTQLSFEESIKDMLFKAGQSSGIDIVFNNELPDLRVEKDEENTIFRVIQESVTNSIRYGKPRKIFIDMSKKDDILQLIIQDDGNGCKKLEPGFGITHMKERVEMLHGTIEFYSEEGFTVKALIPLRKEN